MTVAARGGAFHSDLVARHFRLKGWHVGKDHRRDVCPACQRDARESRKANLTLVPAPEPVPMDHQTNQIPYPTLVADPPLRHARIASLSSPGI
jgi:hypothetical protein